MFPRTILGIPGHWREAGILDLESRTSDYVHKFLWRAEKINVIDGGAVDRRSHRSPRREPGADIRTPALPWDLQVLQHFAYHDALELLASRVIHASFNQVDLRIDSHGLERISRFRQAGGTHIPTGKLRQSAHGKPGTTTNRDPARPRDGISPPPMADTCAYKNRALGYD